MHRLEDGMRSSSQASLAQAGRPWATLQGLSSLWSSSGACSGEGMKLEAGRSGEGSMELPLHRWEDAERWLQSLKELRARHAPHPHCW